MPEYIKITTENASNGRVDYLGNGKLLASDALPCSAAIKQEIISKVAAQYGSEVRIDWNGNWFRAA